MRKSIYLSIFCAFLFSSCGEQLDTTLLHGTWKVDKFLALGKEKDRDLTNVQFSFNDKNVYTYQSSLKNLEAGHYRVERSILYSTDTLNAQRIEKAVKITHLTQDSLYLLMNRGGIEETLIMHRLK